MMEVPAEVLQNLICENCDSYLSRGPVLILANGTNVCGRCVIVKQNVQRNVQYEELAKLMKFPCKYEQYGCQQTISFEENIAHEESCSYHVISCPIITRGKCPWIGVRDELLEHVQRQHPLYEIHNPAKLTYVMNDKASLQNYLLSAFQLLFLIQIKVCLTTRAIYHSVRLIGDRKQASTYSFDLDIKSETGKLNKCKVVAPQGCMLFQVHESIMIDFNHLLGFLDKYRSVTFILTIRATDDATDEQIEQDSNKLSEHVLCVKCQCTTEPVWRDENGWHCKECGPVRELCANSSSGCTYNDIPIKCKKHKSYCKYVSFCIICEKNLTGVTLEKHFSQDHSAIVRTVGSQWSAVNSITNKWSIIHTMFGTALCHYWMYGSKLFMYIRTPLSTEQLYMYKCVVEISHPVTEKRITWTAEAQYFYAWDWELTKPDIDIYDYADKKNKFNVKIDFIDNVHV